MSRTLSDVWEGIEIGWMEENRPDDECIEAASRFLEAITGRLPLPKQACRVYWPTVYFDWNKNAICLEITWSKYAIFIFKPKKEFEVWEYDFSRPEAIADLVEHLSRLVEAP